MPVTIKLNQTHVPATRRSRNYSVFLPIIREPPLMKRIQDACGQHRSTSAADEFWSVRRCRENSSGYSNIREGPFHVHPSSDGQSNNGSCCNSGRFLVQHRRHLNGTLTPHWQRLRMGCWEYGMDPTRLSSLPLPCIFVTHAGGKVPAAKVTGEFLSLAALKTPSKEQTVKKAEWREPGGLFQGSFNSSLTRKSLWCAARFCSLWLRAGVISKRGEGRNGGEINVTQEWESKKVPPPFPRRGSTGTLLQQQLFKVLGYFSPPLMFIYFFVVLECWKLTHSGKVAVFAQEL